MSAIPIFLTGDERWIVARFDQSLYSEVLAAVPGALWDKTRNAWRWRSSERTAVDLIDVLGRIDAIETNAGLDALLAQAHARRAARQHKLAADDDVPPVPILVEGAPPHWVHQRRAFHFARNLSAAGIYIGMGGGKSRVAVDLCSDAHDQTVLILCPKNVIGVWPRQFELYAPQYRVFAPTKGTVAKRADAIEQQLLYTQTAGPPLVVVVNYDSAWRQPMAKLLCSVEWDRIILDESHRVKSAGGKASRFVGQLSRHGRRRLCLTGTPMPHTPLDVYGQYRFLDPGIFGTNFTKFRARYAVMGGYQAERWNPATKQVEMAGTQIVGWLNEEELAERTYSVAYRIAEEELDAILGLEKPLHEVRTFELPSATRKVYEGLYSDFCAQVGDGLVTVDNALVKLLRLAQVTSGYLPVDGAVNTIQTLDQAKADALEELLDDIPPGEQVVVFARFTHDLDEIERVATKLRRTHAELSGRRRDGLTDEATLTPDAEIVGVQMRSGGEGVDFSRARYCVFYSVGFSLGDYDQALKRTHRPGQTRRVVYYHLVASKSVDEQVYRALRERRDVVEYVLSLAS